MPLLIFFFLGGKQTSIHLSLKTVLPREGNPIILYQVHSRYWISDHRQVTEGVKVVLAMQSLSNGIYLIFRWCKLLEKILNWPQWSMVKPWRSVIDNYKHHKSSNHKVIFPTWYFCTVAFRPWRGGEDCICTGERKGGSREEKESRNILNKLGSNIWQQWINTLEVEVYQPFSILLTMVVFVQSPQLIHIQKQIKETKKASEINFWGTNAKGWQIYTYINLHSPIPISFPS